MTNSPIVPAVPGISLEPDANTLAGSLPFDDLSISRDDDGTPVGRSELDADKAAGFEDASTDD